MDWLKALTDILGSVGDITSAGWGGVVVLILAVIAVVAAFIISKMSSSAAAKKESDEKAAKDQVANPVINDGIEKGHQAAEDLIKKERNGPSQ